jgi:hypothetical protein
VRADVSGASAARHVFGLTGRGSFARERRPAPLSCDALPAHWPARLGGRQGPALGGVPCPAHRARSRAPTPPTPTRAWPPGVPRPAPADPRPGLLGHAAAAAVTALASGGSPRHARALVELLVERGVLAGGAAAAAAHAVLEAFNRAHDLPGVSRGARRHRGGQTARRWRRACSSAGRGQNGWSGRERGPPLYPSPSALPKGPCVWKRPGPPALAERP